MKTNGHVHFGGMTHRTGEVDEARCV